MSVADKRIEGKLNYHLKDIRILEITVDEANLIMSKRIKDNPKLLEGLTYYFR